MLNNYEQTYRETLPFKGNELPLRKLNLEIFALLENTIDTDQNATLRCQQIHLFNQMMFLCFLHLIYILSPKITKFPFLYILAWCTLVSVSVLTNIRVDMAKRYPLNLYIGLAGWVSRLFIYLFILQFFEISKFLLVNLMFTSLLTYLKFKSDQQNYYTQVSILEKQGTVQMLQEFQDEDPSQIEDEDWKNLMGHQEDQQENQEQLKQESDFEVDEANRNLQTSFEQLNDEQRSQVLIQTEKQIVDQLTKKQQNIEQQKQQQCLPPLPSLNILMSFKRFSFNYLFVLVSPLILMILFHFTIIELLIVWLINVIFITIIWIHCKTYQSEFRLLLLQYNQENAYLLTLTLFDGDVLWPCWMIQHFQSIYQKTLIRRTRQSLN